MPRRTGVDTIYDNDMPDGDELMAIANYGDVYADPILDNGPADDEDVNQLNEGDPGEFGSNGNADEMDDDEYQAAVSSAIEAAENYIDTELSPDRENAAKYYRGELFGNEVGNRSQVVMSEVRDAVLSLMPPMLRVFCGNTDAVEFINNAGTPADLAEAQTAYVNHILHKDNDGFLVFYSAFKDAFVRKTGIFTWWFEEKEIVTSEDMTGLNEDAYAMLLLEKSESSSEDENIEYNVDVVAERPDTLSPTESLDIVGDDGAPIMPEEAPPQAFIRDVRVYRRAKTRRHRVAAVPPEEFICTPIASDDIDSFPLVGRRQLKSIGELVALGLDEDAIREAIGGQGSGISSLAQNPERVDRDTAISERIFDTGFDSVDPASEYVKFFRGTILIDRDGDGILERREIMTVGDANVVIFDQITDEMVPFALICPDPEPHSPFGMSVADETMDFQEVKSEMVRGVLDSLSESIFGRMTIEEGFVNIDDALSPDRDQIIRIKRPGAVASLSRPFNGMNAMPVLEYLDNMKARRVGVTMSPSGLSPDALQSTSTEAVVATVDASQERSEMIARIFAETGVKRLFRGLLKQVVKHQDQARAIRLRGKLTTVDPRTFNADLDLDTNVGLGRGTAAKRIAALTMILGQQKEIYQTYGAANPIVTLHHISNTVEDLVRENGFNDVSRYMKVISKEEAEQMRQEAQNAPQPPTPEELLYKAQSEKTQADVRKAEISANTQLQIAGVKDDFSRDKLESDFFLRAQELLGKFGIQTDEMQMRALLENDKAATALADHAQTAGQPPAQPDPNATQTGA